MNNRLQYPDICKFVAIFLVTWSHCAQCIAGQPWTNFLGGKQIDIAFNMPMFMLISGWFINPDKIRKSSITEFISSKFKRLIIPSFVWYFIHLLLSITKPGLEIFRYYWYLNALFACLCIILLSVKVFKNNILSCLFSIIFVLLIPYSNYSLINFMLPFLWAGYGLRKAFDTKFATPIVILSAIVGLILCLFWNPSYTVYRAPFNSISINEDMIIAYVFRFVIGFSLSSVFIYLIKKYEKYLSFLAPFGSYSLVIYTSSLAILSGLSKVMNYFHIHTNTFVIIDLYSLCLCSFIIVLTIIFSRYCRKHKLLRALLLGE